MLKFSVFAPFYGLDPSWPGTQLYQGEDVIAMNGPWMCAKIGTLACRNIVHVAPWMMAAYVAVHPLPTNCHSDCHFVIPPAQFMPGGIFGPVVAPVPGSPSVEGVSPGEVILSPESSLSGAEPSSLSAEGLPPGEDFLSPGRSLSGPVGIFPVAGIDVPPGQGEHPPIEDVPPVMVVITRTSIPEPPTLVLLGSGLLALGVLRCRTVLVR
jgi:hypothetical protein